MVRRGPPRRARQCASTASAGASALKMHAAVDAAGRITALGAPAAGSPLITAGFYVLHSCVLAEIDAAREYHFTALRQFLAHLVARDYRVYAAPMGKTVDVDRPQDIAAADAFVRGGYVS